MPTPRPIPSLVCLLLGLAISIAVSWGFSLAYDRELLAGWRSDTERNNTPGQVIEAFDAGVRLPESYPAATWWRRSYGPGRVLDRAMGSEGWVPGEVMTDTRPDGPTRGWTSELERFGWPMVAMQRRGWMSFTIPGRAAPADLNSLASPLGPLDAGLAPGIDGKGLPVIPVWGGLIVNTLVYAGVCWIMLAGVGMARRWNRRRRGRCAGCGYETNELTTCPECGA